jgi:hypothetical protein
VAVSPPGSVLQWPDVDSGLQLQTYLPPSDSEATLVPECTAAPVPLAADSIGPLRVGQSLAALLRVCPRVVPGWDWGDEAIPTPALAIRFGAVVVVATLSDTLPDSRVVYLATASPAARTAEGVHVNMPVDSVVLLLGTPRFDEAECSLYANFSGNPHLGVLLTLPADSLDCGQLAPRPPALPRGSRVARMLLHGGA